MQTSTPLPPQTVYVVTKQRTLAWVPTQEKALQLDAAGHGLFSKQEAKRLIFIRRLAEACYLNG